MGRGLSETMRRRDAAPEPTWMYSRRVSERSLSIGSGTVLYLDLHLVPVRALFYKVTLSWKV